MIQRKFVRYNQEKILNNLKQRNASIDVNIFQLDAQFLELEKELNLIKQNIKQLNKISDNYKRISEGNNLKSQRMQIEKKVRNLELTFNEELLKLPNILHESVPSGQNEKDNVVLRTWFPPESLTENQHTHDTFMNRQLLDKCSGMGGSKMVGLSGDLAKLERILGHFFIEYLKDKDFQEYSLPYVATSETLTKSGHLPHFNETLFHLENNKYLIPTGEAALCNLFSDTIFKENTIFPINTCALTDCFRNEIATGTINSGLIRVCQFKKVEMFSVSTPDKSYDHLEYMTNVVEDVLKLLKLPHRVVLLCDGDTGWTSCKTYDIEIYLPQSRRWLEISSCSNVEDFQSRRMICKYKINNTSEYLHTLNGSCLALGRTIVGIIENYQIDNKTIKVPDLLIPLMNQEIIYPTIYMY